MRLARLLGACFVVTMFSVTGAFAQTGKIAGTITDASTGETIPGVNVVLDGTTQGAVTDADGYYVILNVRPGTYRLRASFVGYSDAVIEAVRVNVNLTEEVNFALREQAVGLDEIVVTSEAPIVQVDVSANVANLDPEEFENLPVAGVDEILDLQAGIEPGLSVRGGSAGEVAFIVDGLNMRTGRTNQPFTNISYTSVEAVQVQTGGFNAEYGNVRSGIVNVTTKAVPNNRYIFDGLFRFTPSQEKALGGLPEDFDSYFIRPALDPDVAFVGTENGPWDLFQQDQYVSFVGWNKIAEEQQEKGFDVTAQDMQDLFRHQHRKSNEIEQADYQADFTLGGPLIPGVSKNLGDLRFLASYRGTQNAYIYPQSREGYNANTYQLKLISDVATGIKVSATAMYSTERGVNRNRNFPDAQVWTGGLPKYPWQSTGAEPIEGISRRAVFIFSDGGLNLVDIDHSMFAVDMTHTLNANTFYTVSLQNMHTKYDSPLPNLRDGSFINADGAFEKELWTDNFGNVTPGFENQVSCFGGNSDITGDGESRAYCSGTEPFGFAGTGGNLLTGETTGGHWSKTRDTSRVSVFTGRFDLTSQVNRFMLVKTGAELIFSDYDMRYGRVNLALVGEEGGARFPWKRSPIQGALYAQSKLEFQGMIANVGLRLDYFDANTDWWVYDFYDQSLRGRIDNLEANAPKEATDAQLDLSPRLGISFPITENSKLYFNYGHFRQMLNPFDIFGIEQSLGGGIDVLGNPEHPLPKTVAYELGFDQNLFDQYLLRVSGFYRDIRDQSRFVRYQSLGGVVDYTTPQPWNYEDIRGLEFTLNKIGGEWFRGFVNYTFTATKSGNFGFSQFLENSFAMRQWLAGSTEYRLNAPLAQPYASMNLQFLTPDDFGPDVAGNKLLGDWVVNFLGEWRSGQKWTWSGGGGGFPELQENVAWRDYWNFDLRFTKHFRTAAGRAQFFMDVSNVFNLKYIYSNAAFHPDKRDFDKYMWSLHLPGDIYDDLNNVDEDAPYRDKQNLPYLWVPGDDRPGDFRDSDVAFQPINAVASLDGVNDPSDIAWYWAKDTGSYHEWNGSAWQEVSDGDVEKVLDDKAYIDMPNLRFNTFLNPRRVTFGLRLSF